MRVDWPPYKRHLHQYGLPSKSEFANWAVAEPAATGSVTSLCMVGIFTTWNGAGGLRLFMGI